MGAVAFICQPGITAKAIPTRKLNLRIQITGEEALVRMATTP
jgi:hypothetical protein